MNKTTTERAGGILLDENREERLPVVLRTVEDEAMASPKAYPVAGGLFPDQEWG